ncbi:MAG: response regulator [Clostridiales bacterium]|nr:response regulator [Clostridiales bacterium]
MLKVIIADDEPKVALLIQNLVDWEGLGMALAGIARNGEEALELIRQHDPDVIITDIRMPVIGGIELISAAKEIKPSLEFVIISGYKHFDYAHSAIKFGVSDYLLKPINQDELASTLEKVKGRILGYATIQSEHERVRQIESDMKRSKRLELFSLLMDPGGRPLLTTENLNGNLSYSFPKGCCYRFVIFKIDGPAGEIYSEGLPVFTEKIREAFHKTVMPLCDDMEMEFIFSGANFVLGFPPENKHALRDALRDVFDDIRVQNNIFPSAVFTMVAGSIAEGPAGLMDSWLSAEWSVYERLLIGAGSFYENLPVRESARGAASIGRAASKGLEQAMDVMDPDAADRAAKEASASLSKLDGLTGKDVLHFAKTVYDAWLILCQRYDVTFPGAEKLRAEFVRELDLLSSASDVYAMLRRTIRESFSSILENIDEVSGRPVTRAKQYIKDRYSENISIGDIADQEGFNVSYFSTLFKKETGQTFSEYLTGVRMDEAKRLLKETNLSIAQICRSVGYSDVKHFTAVFRKSSGVKPSEYRKLYSWGR